MSDAEPWVALIAAGAALGGALGTQLIASRSAIQTRRFEVYFNRKVTAYELVLERIGEVALNPLDETKYLSFLAAYERAKLFASDSVGEALSGKTGLHVAVQRLRAAETAEDRRAIAFTTLYDAQKNLAAAMRADLAQRH